MKRPRKSRVHKLVAGTLVLVAAVLAMALRTGRTQADPAPRARHGKHPARHRSSKHATRLPDDSPWASREACLAALGKGRGPRAAGLARVGAWNLHWFPDGRPGDTPSDHGADLDWLACTIAWMNVDVLAVEEIKRPPRGSEGLAEVERKLDALTSGSWHSVLDDCPRASAQHVGLLFDARRVKLGASGTVGALNPRGEPCKDELRPGLRGYFTFPGGLDLTVVAVHLKSGADARAFGDRARSFEAFAAGVDEARRSSADRDVLLLGDMNSMGCDECAPEISAVAELARTDAVFAKLPLPVGRLAAEPTCSHHYQGKSTLLDWAAKSDLGELGDTAHVVVSGACGELGCSSLTSGLEAQEHLSDHCPVWVDVKDVDAD